MLNFLLQKNKNKIIIEYLLRLTIFVLLSIFLTSLISSALFLPSYFFVKQKNSIIDLQLEAAKQKNKDKGEDPIAFIKNINRLSAVLSTNTQKSFKDSEVVSKIYSLKNKDIHILSIKIDTTIDGSKNISINGIAKTRDNLTSFKNDIEIGGFFKNVSFPLPNFLNNTENSNFSATLNL